MNIFSKEMLFSKNAAISAWIQPILSANGTLGGDSFAVEASNTYSSNYAWKAFDDVSANTYWSPGTTSTLAKTYYTFYNPEPLNVTQIECVCTANNYWSSIDSVEGGNDGTNWTSITKSSSGKPTITCVLNNSEFYKYYKIAFNKTENNSLRVKNITITATVYQ